MAETEFAHVPLLAGISTEAAERLAADGVVDVPAGQVLARADDPGEGMFVVLDGTVVVERGELHLEMGAGQSFGELALLVPGAHRIARVRARTDTRLLAVPRDEFDRLVETEPSFVRALLRELAERLIEARTGH